MAYHPDASLLDSAPMWRGALLVALAAICSRAAAADAPEPSSDEFFRQVLVSKSLPLAVLCFHADEIDEELVRRVQQRFMPRIMVMGEATSASVHYSCVR